jgi:hypothetical protein
MTVHKPFYKKPFWLSMIAVLGFIVLIGGAMTQMPKAQVLAYCIVKPCVEKTADTIVHEHIDKMEREIDSLKARQAKFNYNQEYQIKLLEKVVTTDQRVQAQNEMREWQR